MVRLGGRGDKNTSARFDVWVCVSATRPETKLRRFDKPPKLELHG